MSPLSDFLPVGSNLPESLKPKIIPTILDIGMIMKTFIPEFKINYDKYVVVVATSTCGQFYGCVPVNTDPDKYRDHAVIRKNDHPWLDYDSHICCSTIISLPKDKIDQLFSESPEVFKGNVPLETISQLKNIIKNSRVIVGKIKTQYGLRY